MQLLFQALERVYKLMNINTLNFLVSWIPIFHGATISLPEPGNLELIDHIETKKSKSKQMSSFTVIFETLRWVKICRLLN